MVFSFPVNKKPLFYHLHESVSPISGKLLEKTIDVLESTKDFSKKLFTNSIPNEEKLDNKQDQIRVLSSALEKKYSNIKKRSEERIFKDIKVNKIKKVEISKENDEFSSDDIKKLNDLINNDQ
jgi:hypothetical protein